MNWATVQLLQRHFRLSEWSYASETMPVQIKGHGCLVVPCQLVLLSAALSATCDLSADWSVLSSKTKQQGLIVCKRSVCMSHASMHNGVTNVCLCLCCCCCLAHAGETAVVLPVVFRCLLVRPDQHSSSHGSLAGLVTSLRQGCHLPDLPAQHWQQQEQCRELAYMPLLASAGAEPDAGRLARPQHGCICL